LSKQEPALGKLKSAEELADKTLSNPMQPQHD
jgi:hypothetical protein